VPDNDMQPSPIGNTSGPSLPNRRRCVVPLSLIILSARFARTIATAEVL
jgi:hypothetical protein